MAKNVKKFDFKKVAQRTLITAGVGAVAQVVAEAIDIEKPEYIDYAFMVAGAALPEIVKAEAAENAGGALLAVGAYRLAERKELAKKLGFNQTPKTSGIPPTIGTGWRPQYREVYAEVVETQKKNSTLG